VRDRCAFGLRPRPSGGRVTRCAQAASATSTLALRPPLKPPPPSSLPPARSRFPTAPNRHLTTTITLHTHPRTYTQSLTTSAHTHTHSLTHALTHSLTKPLTTPHHTAPHHTTHPYPELAACPSAAAALRQVSREYSTCHGRAADAEDSKRVWRRGPQARLFEAEVEGFRLSACRSSNGASHERASAVRSVLR
jgi:hypothetical protein